MGILLDGQTNNDNKNKNQKRNNEKCCANYIESVMQNSFVGVAIRKKT